MNTSNTSNTSNTLLLRVGPKNSEWWLNTLQALLPELHCRLWDSPGDPMAVQYAAVWRPPAGGLAQFWNLQAVFSIGAGVDHVLNDPAYPAAVPLFRTVAPDLTQRMIEYVLLHVLRYHRRVPELEKLQSRGQWKQLISPLAADRVVGVMGLGHIGQAVAQALRGIGFQVRGWARSKHALNGIQCFAGQTQLAGFLRDCEILVCLLPLTDATRDMLNQQVFSALPRGAFLINVGRGEHLVEQDLLQALNEGQLAGATLDVFRHEPLPPEHPFWQQPDLTLTPHVASLIDPVVGSKILAQNIRRHLAGDPLTEFRVDVARGY
ncbi:MAG: glyoxylate/hydroxypyruvate reductase A [Candidatus Competibacteraceae bacterium]|nr:glyoxylate/hydroxypyruvate reductase A [Candidatus Competibacteraceae bacterium]MCB1812300.1 glyoxylate/hydroxypyruvate reductase A [Candidatus Competibacteraceae bacterium]